MNGKQIKTKKKRKYLLINLGHLSMISHKVISYLAVIHMETVNHKGSYLGWSFIYNLSKNIDTRLTRSRMFSLRSPLRMHSFESTSI